MLPEEILAIDPGPDESGVINFEDGQLVFAGMVPGLRLRSMIVSAQPVAIEQVTGYGGVMVSNRIRDMILWMGEFRGLARSYAAEVIWIDYPEIMRRLFGTQRAKTGKIDPRTGREKTRAWKDTEIRTRLLDLWGGNGEGRAHSSYGGVKCRRCKGKGWRGAGRPLCEACGGERWEVPPGPLHKIPWNAAAHEWSALAVAWAAVNE